MLFSKILRIVGIQKLLNWLNSDDDIIVDSTTAMLFSQLKEENMRLIETNKEQREEIHELRNKLNKRVITEAIEEAKKEDGVPKNPNAEPVKQRYHSWNETRNALERASRIKNEQPVKSNS